MRKARQRSKSVSGDLQFGSDVAERLALPAEEVAAIVGAIVGGRAAAFVVAIFGDRPLLPMMVLRPDLAGTVVADLIRMSSESGAAWIVCVTPSGSPDLHLEFQDSSECGGVRFEVVAMEPTSQRDSAAGCRKETSSWL